MRVPRTLPQTVTRGARSSWASRSPLGPTTRREFAVIRPTTLPSTLAPPLNSRSTCQYGSFADEADDVAPHRRRPRNGCRHFPMCPPLLGLSRRCRRRTGRGSNCDKATRMPKFSRLTPNRNWIRGAPRNRFHVVELRYVTTIGGLQAGNWDVEKLKRGPRMRRQYCRHVGCAEVLSASCFSRQFSLRQTNWSAADVNVGVMKVLFSWPR
jgi:hypothetical protein